ncbi:hypothetical protein SAMN05444149_103322 [Pseudosulfitobacter pseudonitzschiae]|uniref:Pilus assembly protein n=1 Tax=Pseudosulfitobacter pseudonitzschiae TaxID=1402135 RepID=A0A073J4Z3_9RHOB|nr:hypothetical protein [Pseudosulfitobacter pseudonitzschiae]KEJ96776.1 hypothetical protein SUH3_15585 [Pseudosulfitobacter pseudonitzschiae]QKS07771.1 hypothetical protein HT745_04345 [Pseudosulfitobacter pseudonitzschiae]SHF24821.1 hypothetical protein SAMN05444149_103322 [Pseudosulfitobacter pseudonitzschiae]
MSFASPLHWLRRFGRDEDGNVAIETIIIIPILFWTYLTMFAIFDSYRQYSLNEKAAYTIGDMISRQTTPLNDSYLDGTIALLKYLTRNRGQEPAIRVTSIKYDANNDIYKRDWSHTRGPGISALDNTDVKNWHDRLPVMLHNERIVVVETFVYYDPPFNTGLNNTTITNFVFTRSRYSPQALWEGS